MMEAETSPGTLLASGYIGGDTLAGMAIAILEVWPTLKDKLPSEHCRNACRSALIFHDAVRHRHAPRG
jgi:hypothetical protein